MSNEMTIALFHSEWGIQNDDYLQHYGILGMHWGIRRYQPYGEGGYDPDHEGKNIGLAARLAGHTGSYSDAIKRGSSLGNRAKAAASSFGKRAGKAASEAVERFNYASDRTAQGILNAGKKAKSSLAKYASTERINGHSIEDNQYRNLLESSGFGTLAKSVGIQLKADARRGINSIKHTSFDDVKSALGSGASRFQEAMSRTAVKSKEFGRNAAMTAALFGGALDPRSNASQTVQSRSYAASFPDKRTRQPNFEDIPTWNKGKFVSEYKGGRAQGLHEDALDLAGRMIGSKYGQISKTGKEMFRNTDLTRRNASLGEHGFVKDRSNIGTYSPSDAIRRAGAGLTMINQQPRKDSKGLSRYSKLESLARTSPIEAGRRNATIYDKGTKRGFDRTSEEFNDPEFLDFYRNLKKPWLSQSGRQAARIQQRLGKSGDLYAINQTPAARAISIGGNESTRDIARRLGII